MKDFQLRNLRNPPNTEVNIGDCDFKNFHLSNFRNTGIFKLYKVNILKDDKTTNGKFQIDNTSIGNTDWQNINLTSFKIVSIFDNIFSNLKYTNVNWKEDIEVEDIELEGTEIKNIEQVGKPKYDRKQDTYRSLKNVASANNDQPQALKFYAKEMENHYKHIPWKNNFSSKFTLSFNKWTNNFGLSWLRLFFILLLFSFCFYGGLLCSLDVPIQEMTNSEYQVGYLQFIDPTHKPGFIHDKNLWGWSSYFIDLSFRIIEALLIYQIIQAFRKYSKKL